MHAAPAGLVVVDIDAHAQIPPTRDRLLPGIPISDQVDLRGLATGYHTIGILAALRGATSPADDATTLRVRTPSGGLHVWYRSDGARSWQCSSGSGGGRALAWQVDVRAHGGYIIAPGTTTNAGTYTPVGDSRLPAPLPNWLARELERTGHLPAPQVPSPLPVPARALQAVIAAGGGRTHATRTLATVLSEVTACAAVTEGAGFSAKLNRAAYTAGGLVTGEYITEQQARNALTRGSGSGAPRPKSAQRGNHPQWHERGPCPPAPPRGSPVTTPDGGGYLFDFNPQAVAAQILAQCATSLPAQAGEAHPLLPGTGPATASGLLPDTLSDRGNAKLFVKLYANDYRHVPGLGWYRWDTTRWQMDEDDAVVWSAGDLAENLAVHDPRGTYTSSALQQHRRRALSTSGMNAMLTQARSAPGMVLSAALLDADPYALCTPAGVVDLRTGSIRAADPNKDFHSRSTAVGPLPGPTPRWLRFLADTFGDDAEGQEMVDFLHLLLGYSITGDVGGQVMPFLFGSGKNGKSVAAIWGRNSMNTSGSAVGRPSRGSRAWRWRIAAPASAASIDARAIWLGVIGRWGDIVGV